MDRQFEGVFPLSIAASESFHHHAKERGLGKEWSYGGEKQIMQDWSCAKRKAGERIAFMKMVGYFSEGHPRL
uniref:Uncharacterized protein n=1 Tax=Physcomitrium patens TaxID=3218 RepID=A0A2K1IVH7_PHYPA|nr:hypothetical protein PHYPA_025228 [Physcomitrium patens]